MHKLFRSILGTYLVIFTVSCGSDSSPTPTPPIVAEFSSSAVALNEGDKQVKVVIALSAPLPAGNTVKVTVASGSNLIIGDKSDLYTTPVIGTTPELIFDGPKTEVEFFVNSNFDTQSEADESAVFTLVETSGVVLGTKKALTVTISDGTLDSDLVAEYVFNGNLDDTSGKGHPGTNHGATLASGKSGASNSAYYFSGSSYVTVPNNSDINFNTNQDFTVSLWAEPSAVQNDMAGIINDIIRAWVGDAQGYPFGISYYNSSNTTAPRVFAGARYDGSGCGHIPQAFSAQVSSQYHHVVLQKQGVSIRLFVDNVLAETVTDNTSCNTSNVSDLYIGCRGNLLRCFTGKVDDIRIYNRALTVDEISGLFDMP